MDTNNYEIFRKINYIDFENNGNKFLLSTYPYLDIVFNDHCNAKCKFCISHLVHKKVWSNIEKHKQKIKYAIEQLGVKEVLLLGGEPTINDDIFEIIDYLKQFNINKICTTTNGHRMANDYIYAEKLLSSGITHLNMSIMNLNKEKQMYISGSNTYVSLEDLKYFKYLADENGVQIRINNNCFIDNNDHLKDIIEFYNLVKNCCHSVKFSPLLRTDSFSTVNEVTEFNRTHILEDAQYDSLWNNIETYYSDYPIVRNKETFGFVEYSMIMLDTPIILNYNQHGKLREKVVKENKINNIKLLATGDLSLSWNREEIDYFINTDK
jgi:organic radical activating enzyme